MKDVSSLWFQLRQVNRELQQREDVLTVDRIFYTGGLLLLPRFYYGHQFIPPVISAYYCHCNISSYIRFKVTDFTLISSELLIIERP